MQLIFFIGQKEGCGELPLFTWKIGRLSIRFFPNSRTFGAGIYTFTDTNIFLNGGKIKRILQIGISLYCAITFSYILKEWE